MLLVIDNYDSFTWNLVQYLGELGAEPVVHRNDELTVAQVAAMQPERIVISPGPCTPAEAGISVDVIRELGSTTPILGVCLGHQAIVAQAGGAGAFDGLPSPLNVTRYHSLVLEPESLPPELEITAWTDEPGWEDEVQGIRHIAHPVWGVQFHPESIATERGHSLLENFLHLRI